jgi:hypothetical protein
MDSRKVNLGRVGSLKIGNVESTHFLDTLLVTLAALKSRLYRYC